MTLGVVSSIPPPSVAEAAGPGFTLTTSRTHTPPPSDVPARCSATAYPHAARGGDAQIDYLPRHRLRNGPARPRRLAEHEVHELAGHDDGLHDLVAVELRGDLRQLAGEPFLLVVGGAGGHGHAVAQL